MKHAFTKRPLALALSLAFPLAGLAPVAVEAALQITQSTAFDVTTSLSSSANLFTTPVTASADGRALGSVAVNRFAASTGVLTGVTLDTTGTSVTQSVSVNGVQLSGLKTLAGVTGTAVVGFASPGASVSSAQVTRAISCGIIASGKGTCSGARELTTATTLQANAASEVLDSYVGESGTVLVGVSAPTLRNVSTVSQAGDGPSSSSGKHTVRVAGTVGLTYQYLQHATASFDPFSARSSLTLDFGTIALGQVGMLDWSLANLSDPSDGAGLDFDAVSIQTPVPFFNPGFVPFSGLGGGGIVHQTASFTGTAPGDYVAVYFLNLSDADIGAASTRQSSELVLTLKGTVIDPVPLPAAWSLLLPGLALTGWLGRRRAPPG